MVNQFPVVKPPNTQHSTLSTTSGNTPEQQRLADLAATAAAKAGNNAPSSGGGIASAYGSGRFGTTGPIPLPAAPTTSQLSTLQQALVTQGLFTAEEVQAMTPAELLSWGQAAGLVNKPSASGGGAAYGPDAIANAQAQNILNNFNPDTDFIKLPGLGNQYLIRGTNKTVDLSDPSKFSPVNNPDGTSTGFFVNSQGQTFNSLGNQIAASQLTEQAAHDRATEATANQQAATQAGQLTETTRSNTVNEGLTQQTIDATKARDAATAANQAEATRLQALDTAAKLQADPGNFVQAEYERRGLTAPVTPPPPVDPAVATQQAADTAAATQATNDFNSAHARAVTANVEYNTAHPPGGIISSAANPSVAAPWVPPKGMTLAGSAPATPTATTGATPAAQQANAVMAAENVPSWVSRFAYGTGGKGIISNVAAGSSPDPSTPAPTGMTRPGNIDLSNRPPVTNPDGSVSTVRSISIGVDGKTYLIPTVVGGKVVTNDEAIQHFMSTGEHLGEFDNNQNADTYAQQLHEQQANSMPKYANGTPNGMTTAPVMEVGDPQQGQPVGNPEIVQNPTNAPISVTPTDGVTSPPDGSQSSQPTQEQPDNPAQDTVLAISKIMAMVGKLIKPGDSPAVAHDISTILLETLKDEQGEPSPNSMTPSGMNVQGNTGQPPVNPDGSTPQFAYGSGQPSVGMISSLVNNGQTQTSASPPPNGFFSRMMGGYHHKSIPKYAYGTDNEGNQTTGVDAYQQRGIDLNNGRVSGGQAGSISASGGATPVLNNTINTTSSVASPTTSPAATPASDPNSVLLSQIQALGFNPTDTGAIQKLPSISELSGTSPYTYGSGSNGNGTFTGGFGAQLPFANNINYGRYLDIKQDPLTYGLLSSLYKAGSQNLDAEAARAKALAPIGSGIFSSSVRT